MLSFEKWNAAPQASWRATLAVLILSTFVVASAPIAGRQPTNDCAAGERPFSTPVTVLRRSVESGPIYTALAAASPRVACRVSEESGALSLDYRFRDGGWLRVKRDPAIEYTEYEAHFVSTPKANPITILKRAERAAFGKAGCGIDWRAPERGPAPNDSSEDVIRFRGSECNCQASFHRDESRRVDGLTFHSAC